MARLNTDENPASENVAKTFTSGAELSLPVIYSAQGIETLAIKPSLQNKIHDRVVRKALRRKNAK
jgi:hypothetical protein